MAQGERRVEEVTLEPTAEFGVIALENIGENVALNGFSLLRAASVEYDWHVNLSEIARIWKGGCIIRAALLDGIMQAFERAEDLSNLLRDGDIGSRVSDAERGWRSAVQSALDLGIAVPAMSASLAYFDSYRSARLPQNLTQAQRDFFGAHGYQRVDRPEAEPVHTDWRPLVEDNGHRRSVAQETAR